MRKINIISPGEFGKGSPEALLFGHYRDRSTTFSISLAEYGSCSAKHKIQEECNFIKSRLKNAPYYYFHMQGAMVTSKEFTQYLSQAAPKDGAGINLVIGGAYGVNEEISEGSAKIISFGAITLPHLLFRVVLMEQIYRAHTIISGLNYHL